MDYSTLKMPQDSIVFICLGVNSNTTQKKTLEIESLFPTRDSSTNYTRSLSISLSSISMHGLLSLRL